MFSITREGFIEAGRAETDRLRNMVKHHEAAGRAVDQEQIDWWVTRIANVQFAIEHLSVSLGDATTLLPPSEFRALMEILYG